MEMIMELIENGEEKGGWVKRWGFWGGGGVGGEGGIHFTPIFTIRGEVLVL